MTAFSLSALGLPPFSGFWAKFYVFKAALAAGPLATWAAVVGLVGSVVAAFYYLRLIKVMWFDPPRRRDRRAGRRRRGDRLRRGALRLPVWCWIALVVLDPLAATAAAAFAPLRLRMAG